MLRPTVSCDVFQRIIYLSAYEVSEKVSRHATRRDALLLVKDSPGTQRIFAFASLWRIFGSDKL